MYIESKWRRPRYRRLSFPLEEAISVTEYCRKYKVSRSTVKYRIATNKLAGFKSGFRWWVADVPSDS